MSFTTQQNFTGVLDGTNVNELNKKIDYTKTKFEDRKQIIESILSETSFYSQYFDNYFKSNINSKDSLSQDINVCRSLERMAKYLVNSDEIKNEENSEKTQYVFYTSSKPFQKKMKREQSIEALTEAQNGGHSGSIIHFLMREGKNHKKSKEQTISSNDLRVTKRNDEKTIEEVRRILGDYQSFLDFITEELKNKESKYNRYLLTKVKGQLTQDMIYSKDALLGVWGYDLQNFYESTGYNIDVFDFTDEVHLKGSTIETESGKKLVANGLLFFKPNFDPGNDFSFILFDLEETIKKANLTNDEKFVLDSIRNGMTQEEIAKQLGIYKMKVSRMVDRIARKVAKVGNKYDIN